MKNPKAKEQKADVPPSDFDAYFKVGVSNDYILMRRDFPMTAISPCDFSTLVLRMFQKNEEVRHGK